jgi:D-alanyl-D-alanine carboxypeptidase
MALLGRALLRDFPRRYAIFATRSFHYGSARYGNHNRLLGVFRGMDGIKTGYTNSAGFNLVASAKRKDRRILGVVMGAPSSRVRNALMVQLLDKGFRTTPNEYAGTSAASGRQVAKTKSTYRLAAKRSHHGSMAVASRTARPSADAERKTASTRPPHAGRSALVRASLHSGKSATSKGNPGLPHATLSLR